MASVLNRKIDMLTTEYLANGTLLIHATGRLDGYLVKEIGLLVFRSFHLGINRFSLNLKQTTHIDQDGYSKLELIEKGVLSKGGVWRIIRPQALILDQLLLRISLLQLPPENLN